LNVHPGDVAEYLESQLADLRAQIDAEPDLGVSEFEFSASDWRLKIRFVKRERSIVRVGVPSELVGPGGAQVQGIFEAPDLGAPARERELILSMNCQNLDGQPPSAELLTADGAPLPAGEWPREMGNQGIVRQGHPDVDRPFFCRPGLREYHSHPQHEDEPWDAYREAWPLTKTAMQLLWDLHRRWTFSS
jgi:hypothetical protein